VLLSGRRLPESQGIYQAGYPNHLWSSCEKPDLKIEIQLITTTRAQPINPVKNRISTAYMHQTASLWLMTKERASPRAGDLRPN
jgi:hypothetical protein